MTKRRPHGRPLSRRMIHAVFQPRLWPRWVRRLFIIALPVAPLGWLTVVVLVIVVVGLGELGRTIREFWNAPQQYHFRYSDYEYFRRDRSNYTRPASISPPSGEEDILVPAE